MKTEHDEPVTIRDYFLALRAADEKLHAERDRRYSEVNVEREKALKIKEEADRNALVLAREIQAYRDAQHNDLLRQWQNDRSKFVSVDKFDAALEPLGRDLQARGTRGTTLSAGWAYVIAAIGAFVAVVSAGVAIWTVLTR